MLKEHLDFILEGIRHMPDPGKLIQPLGWALTGVAGTAGVEAYNATAGSAHRHSFVLLGVLSFLAGAIALYADHKLNKEKGKQAVFLEKYVLKLYEQFELDPPAKDRHWAIVTVSWCWAHVRRQKAEVTQ